MNILNTVMKLSGMANHIMDISAVKPESGTTSVTDANKIDETTMIFAQQKALGDASNGFGLAIMHSYILARYKALGLVEYAKYNNANGLQQEVNLPTINGLVVIPSDRYTTIVGSDGEPIKYVTTIAGRGALLTARKTNYNEPYYTDYDPESKAGIEKLYTKEGRVLHPNGFSLDVSKISEESPTKAELGTEGNWSLAFNEKNVRIGQIISNG